MAAALRLCTGQWRWKAVRQAVRRLHGGCIAAVYGAVALEGGAAGGAAAAWRLSVCRLATSLSRPWRGGERGHDCAPGAPRLDDALEAGHELGLARRSIEGGLLVLDLVLEIPARREA